MGAKLGKKTGKVKVKDYPLLVEARAKLRNKRRLAEFEVKQEDRHSLVLPQLMSRLATATVLSYYGRNVKVITTVIVINRASRAYIIT